MVVKTGGLVKGAQENAVLLFKTVPNVNLSKLNRFVNVALILRI